ncbi:Protein C21orf2 [Orchesella cincta]|uniref:Protein C21orf2 n=1 Tax=Orchesella cincta TaxID=48709 RepID=A0A1D2NAX0_ORCCI|nr:Protein C21orf2 [Orchesella cincta]
MTKLTEDMIIARTKSSDLTAVKKLNCWGSDLDDISLVRSLSNVEVLSLSFKCDVDYTLSKVTTAHSYLEFKVRNTVISMTDGDGLLPQLTMRWLGA